MKKRIALASASLILAVTNPMWSMEEKNLIELDLLNLQVINSQMDEHSPDFDYCYIHSMINVMTDDYHSMYQFLEDTPIPVDHLFYVNDKLEIPLSHALKMNKIQIAFAIADFLNKYKKINHFVSYKKTTKKSLPFSTKTPLMYVLKYPNKELFDYLLDTLKADVSIKTTPYHESALGYAAEYCKDNTYFFDKILSLNPDLLLNRLRSSNQTVLFTAVEANNIKTVKYILDKIKTLSVKQRFLFPRIDRDGPNFMIDAVGIMLSTIKETPIPFKETPLHCAAKNGFYNIVKLLLEYGADRSLSDEKGNSVHAVTKDDKILELLYNFHSKK